LALSLESQLSGESRLNRRYRLKSYPSLPLLLDRPL
jgi:hypothetical protein